MRRQFLIATGALLIAPVSHAQPMQKARRIGWLTSVTFPGWITEIKEALHRLGYQEGKHLTIESRSAEGKSERLPALADELVRSDVEVILTVSNVAALAAKRATTTIPIVMSTSAFVVDAGIIKSYARPEGNVTGVEWFGIDQTQKVYQILKSAAPGAKRAAALWSSSEPHSHFFGDEYTRRVAAKVGLSIERIDFKQPGDLVSCLDQVEKSRADVLFVGSYQALASNYQHIAQFALTRKLVSIGVSPGYAGAGGLIYYGAHGPSVAARVASYVDRILRGAKPADLPIEQPTKYELVLNKKTLNAMGVTLPSSFMAQVDRVIE